MQCRKCYLPMRHNPNSDQYECPNGHKLYMRVLDDTVNERVTVDVPYRPPEQKPKSAYAKRVEKMLAERKKYLDKLCVTEKDIIVRPNGLEYIITEGIDGEPAKHDIPPRLTRSQIFRR